MEEHCRSTVRASHSHGNSRRKYDGTTNTRNRLDILNVTQREYLFKRPFLCLPLAHQTQLRLTTGRVYELYNLLTSVL